MALRTQVVDLIGLKVMQQPHQRCRIAQVAIMEKKLHTMDMAIHVKMIDALSVERA